MGIFTFFRRKPKVRKPSPKAQAAISAERGHRGLALRDRDKPDLSPENQAKWKTLTSDDVTDFVYNGQIQFVHSSNVAAAQYDFQNEKMMVEFLDSSAYLYSEVTELEAVSFMQAGSKGTWVWDNLRVRGSKTAHRKPYVRLR